jgi:hypothetical protein
LSASCGGPDRGGEPVRFAQIGLRHDQITHPMRHGRLPHAMVGKWPIKSILTGSGHRAILRDQSSHLDPEFIVKAR